MIKQMSATQTVELRLAYELEGEQAASCDFCGEIIPLDELVATGSFGPSGFMCVDGIQCDRGTNDVERNTNTAC